MRPRRDVPVHWLRPNDTCWSPPEVAVFDTETDETTREDRALVMRPVAWCGVLVQRRTRNKTTKAPAWGRGTTAASLTAWVDAAGMARRGLWCFAHNLAFDAAATDLPNRLVRAGWESTGFSVRGDSPWFRFAKGSHRLVLVDSWSWLPAALEHLGQLTSLPKLALPDDRGDNPETWARCARDVEITTAAVTELMDWWDRQRLGRWQMSGAGTGWSAFRHRGGAARVLVDPDAGARAFERAALYGGRRDAFRVGGPWEGAFVDFDLVNAYPSVAATEWLPARRGRPFDSLPIDSPVLRAQNTGVIAQVTLSTDAPVVPVRTGGMVVYPTGTFTTVLASPELVPLVKAGRVLAIGPGYTYRLADTMGPWARWVLDVVHARIPDTPPVARLAAKHWSRAVIGKWASRTHDTQPWGPAGAPGWAVEEARVQGHDVPAAVVDFAGTRHLVLGDQETDNAFPAVTAFVESHVRVALGRAMAAFRGGEVLTCDTDGFTASCTWLTPEALGAARPDGRPARRSRRAWEALAALSEAVRPLTLVPKATWSTLTVLGPQHIIRDDTRTFSGIRGDAVETAPGAFTAHTWPKLTWQMQHGVPGGYVRPQITAHVSGPYTHRWVLAGGATEAPGAHLVPGVGTVLDPWPTARSDELAPGQHPVLHRIR